MERRDREKRALQEKDEERKARRRWAYNMKFLEGRPLGAAFS
jgi:hypothetical protein